MASVAASDHTHHLPGYTFLETIYRGIRTTVYRAVKIATQQPVMVKVLSQEYPSFTGLVQFRNQYEITKHLPIPGIARPLSLESCGNGYALVMEDRGGTDLGRYVQQNPLGLAEILDIAVHLASILHGLHQHRIIHKDIKPANILIQPELKQVELIDFSIASLLPKESQEIQSPSTLEGTLVYMAPEQTGRMNRAVDYRSDFYALGVTLYELLTGQLPFASDDPLTLIHCHMAQIAAAVDQVNPAVPTVLAAIVAKLMAKNAEERYQSALGLKHDLEQCLQQWQVQGNIADFELGQRDVCDRFLIPEKLYGREAEVQTLLDAFERVAQGSSELMLVAGFSGIGKTAVVNEVHKPITRQKGYFIKGKFDQFNRNIPFSAFVQAFRSLMQQLLSESDSALSVWKQGILEAVGSNGQVLIDVIPELKRIIGTQPTVSELSGSAAQERFNLLFSKFVKVFTTFEHPLVIFLDDLQWADSASLNLLKLLMSKSALGYLLVLGAYRDNEVPAGHSLMLTLDDIARQGAILNTLTLTPLRQPNITQLVADALFCSPELAKPLSKIVHQKTQGNPFFTTQFLQGLQAEGCITFDINAGHWECDLAQVRQLAMTDNVVEFMVRRLQKLPSAVQRVMKLAACVGNRFDLPTLALVCEGSQEKAAADLWCALQAGLIIPENETYKFFQGHQEVSGQASNVVVEYRFLHDRVQQAAYNLIPASERPNIHLKLAEIFEAKASDSASKEIIFEIINHYNQSPLHELSSKRFWDLVNLNIQAAKTAKSATAFEAANTYLTQALTLIDGLDPQPWEHQYTLILDLYIALIKVKNACLLWNESKEASQLLYKNSRSQIDKSISLQLLIEQSTQRGEFALAIEYGQEALTLLGEKLPNTDLAPALQDLIATVQQQSEAIALLQCGQFRSLEDKRLKQVVAILSSLDAPAYLAFPELWKVINALSVKITLLHGITSESAAGFARFGQILCGQLDGSYAQGFAFSQLALKLSNLYPEQKGLVCFEIGLATNHWSSPLRENIDYFQTGFQAAMECGIVLYAGYNLMFQPYYRHYLGQEISEILTLTQQYADFAKQTKNALADILIAGFLPHLERLNATLDAKEWHDWSDSFIEQVTEQQNPLALAMHIITVGQLNFLLGDLNSAEAAFSKASNLKSTLLGYFSLAEYSFYRALLGLQSISAGSADLSDTADLIHTCVDDLEQWANQNPDNFAHKYKLVSAEQHRVSGDRLTALDLYDCAIATARSNQYLQDEALANELAAKFYLDWGKEKVAAGYMQEAYYCYSRWGAKAKVMDLEARYPELLRPILQPVAPSEEVMSTLMSIAAPTVSAHSSTHHSSSTMGLNQTLDFASVLKASQVLSSVIEFDELLSQLTQIILQNSGGDRCALALLDEAGHWQVRAMATPDGTQLCMERLSDDSPLPVKLIQYVKNTQEVLIINDLETDLPVVDAYLRQHQPKSLLGLPVLNQGRCIGVLSLENRLTSGIFTNHRILVLNFLCTQAAISLDNARLYQQEQHKSREIAQKEAEYRSIFESVKDGLVITDLATGRTVAVNPIMCEMHGYSKKEWLALQPDDFIHPDYLHEFSNLMETLNGGEEFETQAIDIRKDGSFFDVEVKSVPFIYQGKPHGLSIIRDISDRKRADEAILQKSQALEITLTKLQNTQLQLVQSEKMSALGGLVAGVAHEINNPVGCILGNVGATQAYIGDLLGLLDLYAQRFPEPGIEIEDELEAVDLDYLRDDLPKLIRAMQDSGDRIKSISQSLRTFSRADTDSKQPFDLKAGIESTLLILRHRLKANNQRSEIEVATDYGSIPEIDCFPGQLNQVFMNILANAIDALDETSQDRSQSEMQASPHRIEIRTAAAGQQIEVTIADNGPGIPKEIADKVFEHLFTTKEVGKGTGLGLAIARQIVEDTHGGTLQVRSEVGQGTTFYIRLPR